MQAVEGSNVKQPATVVVGGAQLKPIHTNGAPKNKDGEEKGKTVAAMPGDDEESEPLSPMARLFHEPKCNLHIIAIIGSTTQIDPLVVKANLVHTLLKHPRFSSLHVVDKEKKDREMKWVRTEVDLEKHVIVPADITQSGTKSPDKLVQDYISNLSNTTLDPSRPLWDLHLLNIQTVDAAAMAVLRIHHSLGDGVSLMSLLLACTRKTSDPEALPTLPIRDRIADKSRDSFRRNGFWSTLRLLWNTVVDVMMFAATALFLKDTETPLRRRGGHGGGSTRRRFVHKTVRFSDVKLVKNAMGVTINDVVLGVVQAGLSRYLNRRYGNARRDKGETERKNNLPKKIRFRAPLFINLRPSPGIPALADMMSNGSVVKWGNCIGYVLLPFKISLHDDPLEYVREAKATVDRKKHSLEALCTFPMADLIIRFLGMKAGSILTYRIPSHTTICFSNMVGPQEEIGFYGHPLSYIAPSCYGQPNALMIHIQTYVDKMTFVLSVDETVIPDSQRLCDDLEKSLQLIKEAILAKKSKDA